MKDDLLIRFIDGRTTPEETECVLRELSQDGEAAKEWLQMVQGARLADTKPLQRITSDEFIVKTLAEKNGVPPKDGKVVRLPWIIGGIAAVAASVALVVTFTINNTGNKMPENIVAETTDTATVHQTEDSVTKEKTVDIIKGSSHESIAKAEVPAHTETTKETEGIEEPTIGQPMDDSASSGMVAGQKITQISAAAEQQSVVSMLEMTKPAKSPYRVKVKNPEKEFLFEWQTANVAAIELTVADSNGTLLFNAHLASENQCGIVASKLVDRGILTWQIKATFNDGTTQIKTGEIELVLVK